MARPYLTLVLGLGLLAVPACGRKGPLVLPAGREPMPVEKLTAVRRGDTVVLEWVNPVKSVAGRPLSGLAAAEVWVFDGGLPAGGAAPSPAEVAKQARLARRIVRADFGRYFKRPGDEAGGMSFVFAPPAGGPADPAFTVRVFDAKGRASEFAPPAAAGKGGPF